MRLRRLDLTRYGRFTNQHILFGERRAGVPDLHIVYGPNEAGKSTALAAFLDLLFGIEVRSRFNFIHAYAAMRIGATIEFADQARELVRVKRETGSLLDGADQPLAEGMIEGELGGVGRDAYRKMFSLDEEMLEEGGKSILESKGDLGRVLFAASSGLAELSRRIDSIKEKADKFYKFHARKHELATLVAKVGELRAKREALDVAAPRYALLREAHRRATANYEAARTAQTHTAARSKEIARLLAALPRLDDIERARAQLEPLACLPQAPADWPERLPKVRDADVALAADLARLDRDSARLAADLERDVPDGASLGLAPRIEAMAKLGERYQGAAEDIPKRRAEAARAERAITALLERLGRPTEAAPARLLLDSQTSGTLRALIERHSGVATAHGAALRERGEAERRLARARACLAASGGAALTEATREALARARATAEAGNFGARLRDAERASVRLQNELERRLAALRPWQGSITTLIAPAPPTAKEIADLAADLAARRNERERWEKDVERLGDERTALAAKRGAIATHIGAVDDEAAMRVRAAREAAWTLHRQRLDAPSADAFEAALRRDDAMSEARLLHQAELEEQRQTQARLAVVEAREREAAAALARVLQALEHRERDVRGAIDPFLPGASLAAFASWLVRRGETLETAARLEEAERALRETEEDAAAAKEKLWKALLLAGEAGVEEADLDALCDRAATALDRARALEGQKEAVREREGDFEAREKSLADRAKEKAAWEAAWREACERCWLGEAGATPAVVQEILPVLGDLARALETRARLLERVEDMRRDQDAFAAEVAAIAAELGVDGDGSSVAVARRIEERLARARAAEERRKERAGNLAKLREERAKVAATRLANDRIKKEMTAFFAVETLDEVREKLAALADKRRLEKAITDAEREIEAVLSLPLAAAKVRLSEIDRASLTSERDALEARLAEEEQRTRELFADLRAADAGLAGVGEDDQAARLEEQRQTTLLEIEEGARRHLCLRFGVAAAEQALGVYRRRHRSAMMAEASEAFRVISRGAYERLESQPSQNGEELIAIGPDGGSKVVDALSRGTRFQLYLALRVAAYREFTRSGKPPVPFIADDIMESFDDFRAEEALRVLAKMAEVGQVIHLTHHRHLAVIAQRVCPSVTVHELTADPPVRALEAGA